MLPFDCDNFISYHERMYQSLCNHRGTNEDIVALKLMSDPILADVVNDISRWVMVLAQLADLRNQENGKWLTYSELFDLAQDNRLNNTESTGKSLVTMAISVVDLAIVSYSMTYGPDVAELCLKDIIESTENAKSAISIAKKNSFIANNMSQLLAEKLYTGKKYSRPPKTVYRTAFLLAQDKSDNNFTLLKELFGQTVEITLNKYGVPSFKLQVEGEELLLALPAPGAMVEGRLSMPRRYFELLGTREQLVDRLSGYNILDGLDDEEAIFISEKISRTINTDLN